MIATGQLVSVEDRLAQPAPHLTGASREWLAAPIGA
jgi:hypothetical protein